MNSVSRISLVLLIATAASLSSAVAADDRVDFGPLVLSLADIAGGVAVTALGWLGLLLRSLLKTRTELYTQEIDAHVREYLDAIIHKGIDFALEEVGERAAAGSFAVDLKNELVGAAGEFIASHAPDAIRRFDLTAEKIANMVRARLDVGTLLELEDLAGSSAPAQV